jgi:hypothetical protein
VSINFIIRSSASARMGSKENMVDEKEPYSEWNEMKKALRSIKHSFPHLLSHHPHCKYYNEDVLHVGRHRLCWGCIVTYPTMFLFISLILIFGFQNDLSWWKFIIVGAVFGSFEFISLWKKGKGLRHRTIKFFLGVGLALMIVGVFTIPIHLGFRILILVQLYLIAGFFGSLRIRAMEKKCKKCGWNGNWNRCPGFEEMNSKLEENDLITRNG